MTDNMSLEVPNRSNYIVNIFSHDYILRELQCRVVGNDKLLHKLSAIASMYTMMLKQNLEKRVDQSLLPHFSFFISGPTGTGKTYSAKVLADILQLPFKRIDCSALTPNGYDGTDLIEQVGNWREYLKDPQLGGILFLDELDKLTSVEDNKGFHRNTQNTLLDIVTGETLCLEGALHRSSLLKSKDLPSFNNILVIAGGSFQTLRDAKKGYGGKIGFHEEVSKDKDLLAHRNLLIKGGLIPELVGRFLDIEETVTLTRDQIRDIMLNPTGTYYKYIRINNGIHFLTKDDIEEVVGKVIKGKYGLRELDGLIFNKFSVILKDRIDVGVNYSELKI